MEEAFLPTDDYERFPTVGDVILGGGRKVYPKTWGLCQHRINTLQTDLRYEDTEWKMIVSLDEIKLIIEKKYQGMDPDHLILRYWIDMMKKNKVEYAVVPLVDEMIVQQGSSRTSRRQKAN